MLEKRARDVCRRFEILQQATEEKGELAALGSSING
jgi:hypothetical protein